MEGILALPGRIIGFLGQMWEVLVGNTDLFITGFTQTIILFLISGVLSFILGVIVGAFRVSPVPALRLFGTLYVNLIRNTPLTLVLFFLAFGYPRLGLPSPGFFVLAIAGLTIYTATYMAEAIRSGINTVPVGQAEAARAIGMPFGLTMTQVVMPQALRAVMPPIMNVLIALMKNTTVTAGFSVVSAGNLLFSLSERSEPALASIVVIIVIFVLLVLVLAAIQRWFEAKWSLAR